jgi:RNA polymerase sigma-70 factor (ECF subfamily)
MVMVKESSITAAFSSYSSTLRRIVSRIVRPHEIDDIVQETFIKTYEAELKDKIKYPRSYMLKTAKNLAYNHQAKWDNKFSDSLEDFIDPPPFLHTQSFEQQYETKERFLLFCRAVEQLTVPVRKCFILKKVYGLSQKEIADYLTLSQSTVEKHVAKGLLLTIKYLNNNDEQPAKITKEFHSKNNLRVVK